MGARTASANSDASDRPGKTRGSPWLLVLVGVLGLTEAYVMGKESLHFSRIHVRSGKGSRSRIAEETRAQLITALETILDRAPSAVIEDIARILIDRAGKYGGPR